MKKNIHRIASLIMSVAVVLASYSSASAATIRQSFGYSAVTGNSYYVSTTGSDANPGTVSAPFKTFAKASSVLQAGSTLYIYTGTYNERLKISNSGTATAGISVMPYNGPVVIDMNNSATSGIELTGSYITIKGLEVTRSGDVCVNLTGSNLVVDGLVVHECMNHGIQTNAAAHIKILNSRVYRAVLSNAGRTMTSGWGSAIKIRISDDVLVQGNIVYNNYGEGLGTRGTNITLRGNTVYDNFSVNIYTNSENALIEGNFVYCTQNSGYERDGLPAAGISMSEEYFEGWGARLKNTKVINNIVAFCKHGVRYNGADAALTGGGLKNATIAYNTLYGSTNSALSIVYESAQTGSLIANNIIWQADNKLANVENSSGLTFMNNLWKALPPLNVRSPGDRMGEPGFSGNPGYKPNDYRPGSSSLAGAGGADIGITNDFFGNLRKSISDVGAIQFSSPSPIATLDVITSLTSVPATPIPASLTPIAAIPTTTPLATETSSPTITPTSTSIPTTIPPTATQTAIPTIITPIPASPTIVSSSLSGKTYDDKDVTISYSGNWNDIVKPSAYNGSFKQTSVNGSWITFNFTGQSFSIIFKGGPSYRKMDVYIDGQLAGVIDQRLATSQYYQRWDYTGQLTLGQHTLKLVFVTNTTSSVTYGSLDAVIIR